MDNNGEKLGKSIGEPVIRKKSPGQVAVEICQGINGEQYYNTRVFAAILGIPRNKRQAFENRLRAKHRRDVIATGSTLIASGLLMLDVLGQMDDR